MLWGCVKVQEHICVASFPVARCTEFANVVLRATNAQGPAAGMRLCLCVDLHKYVPVTLYFLAQIFILSQEMLVPIHCKQFKQPKASHSVCLMTGKKKHLVPLNICYK